MIPVLLLVVLILSLNAFMEHAWTGDVSSGATLAVNVGALLVLAVWAGALVGILGMAAHADTSAQRWKALMGAAAWVLSTVAFAVWMSSP